MPEFMVLLEGQGALISRGGWALGFREQSRAQTAVRLRIDYLDGLADSTCDTVAGTTKATLGLGF